MTIDFTQRNPIFAHMDESCVIYCEYFGDMGKLYREFTIITGYVISNPLRTKLSSKNINKYLQFLSFLDIDMAQV